jgi:hypothetical protein
MVYGREGGTFPEFLGSDPFNKAMDRCALTKHITLNVWLAGDSENWRNPDELKENVQQLVRRGQRDMDLVFATRVLAPYSTQVRDHPVSLLRVVEPAFLCLHEAGFENLRICMAVFDLNLVQLVGQLESDARSALFVFFFPVHDTLLTNFRLVMIEDAKQKPQQRIEDAIQKRNWRS